MFITNHSYIRRFIALATPPLLLAVGCSSQPSAPAPHEIAISTAGIVQAGGVASSSDDDWITSLYIEAATGGDDLRGGSDNIDLTITFDDGSTFAVPNLNAGQTWSNWTTNGRTIPISPALDARHIAKLTLSDTFSGGLFGDNWNMSSMWLQANTPRGAWLLASYPAKRFTGDDRALGVAPAQLPPIVTSITVTPTIVTHSQPAVLTIYGSRLEHDVWVGPSSSQSSAWAACTSTSPGSCSVNLPPWTNPQPLTLYKYAAQANSHAPPVAIDNFELSLGTPPAPPPLGPGCTLASTCDAEYFPPANGGDQTIETIHTTCFGSADVLQELVNGAWVNRDPYQSSSLYATTTPGVFKVGVQSEGKTTSGAAIGSTPTLRACTQNGFGLRCDDSPAQVQIANCCQPMTCEGRCGAVTDGCGTPLHCSCGDGQACVNNQCVTTACTTPSCCAADDNCGWVNGHCKCVKPHGGGSPI